MSADVNLARSLAEEMRPDLIAPVAPRAFARAALPKMSWEVDSQQFQHSQVLGQFLNGTEDFDFPFDVSGDTIIVLRALAIGAGFSGETWIEMFGLFNGGLIHSTVTYQPTTSGATAGMSVASSQPRFTLIDITSNFDLRFWIREL